MAAEWREVSLRSLCEAIVDCREQLDEAHRKLTRISSPQLIDANHQLHYSLERRVLRDFTAGMARSDGATLAARDST